MQGRPALGSESKTDLPRSMHTLHGEEHGGVVASGYCMYSAKLGTYSVPRYLGKRKSPSKPAMGCAIKVPHYLHYHDEQLFRVFEKRLLQGRLPVTGGLPYRYLHPAPTPVWPRWFEGYVKD